METATPTQTALATQDAAYYRDILHTLIDQGAALAARIHATATAATTPDSAVPEATIAFDRAARSVRRTIALARHIAAELAKPATPAHPARATNRAQLIRGVEDAIHAKHRDGADSLYAELTERLEDPELELDLAGRSIDEVIEEICRDLGVAKQGRSYVWRRRTPAEIHHLRQRAQAHPHSIPRLAPPTPPSSTPPNRPGRDPAHTPPPDPAALLLQT